MKRRRTQMGMVPIRGNMKRPIDKKLIAVAQTVTNSVTASTLHTTTFPGTVTGLRWAISAEVDSTTANPVCAWAIVIVHDGDSANTPSLSNASDFYAPEQDVLAFGYKHGTDADVGQGPSAIHWEGSTKTMRKLRAGDTVQFITISGTANSYTLGGVIQFFIKT